jgi:hypothetical protein
MRITLEANPSDAPCCVKIIAEDGRGILIQTDRDFPGIASNFGWNLVKVQAPGHGYGSDYYRPTCEHRASDGTVNCPECGVTASDFICSARQWIDDNDGAEAEDPGYFNEADLG